MRKKQQALPAANAARLARNWQRCRQESLPGLFYAYDDKEEQGERVVTYSLPKTALKDLLAQAEKTKNAQLVVHLGLRKKYDTEELPKEPAFVLLLQLRGKDADPFTGCYELAWVRNGRFSAQGTDSGSNAIPAAGAYLFVHSWMEMAEEDLAAPFTAVTKVLGKRVKRYVFSKAESQSILQDIVDSKAAGLEIHLGNGLAVWVHPFSFRPVIEVKKVAPKGSKSRKMLRNTTGMLNEDGDSYYDFSVPEPPPQEG